MAPARPELDEQLATILNALQFCFVLADCREPDNPITYASSGFYDLTGYSPDEVIGRNCRFLQGPETSRQKVLHLLLHLLFGSVICLPMFFKTL